MATQIHHPQSRLDPLELDLYLAKGWRPTGQSVYTADYLRTDDDELHGSLQVRLPLRNFSFKKRHAKLLRRNGKRFTVSHAVAEAPDEELQRVNLRYLEMFPNKSREDLEYNVFTDDGGRPLDTRIFRVYDGEQLVAFSYFDLGKKTMYTKSGIYDPDYARNSLGIYTLLLEVGLSLDMGLEYYYPGYFSPTYGAFDYKLQLGDMEYREVETGSWLPLPKDREEHPEDPLTINQRKLMQVGQQFANAGMQVNFREYPSFTGRFRPLRKGESPMLDAPLLLTIGRPLPMDYFWVVTYDNASGNYHFDLVRTANLYDMRVLPFSDKGTPRFTTPVVIDRRVLSSQDPALIVQAALSRTTRNSGH